MPFADDLIGPSTAAALLRAVHAAVPQARLETLSRTPLALDGLSLRERSDLLRDALLIDLPGDYPSFADVIRTAQQGQVSFSGWLIWPITSAFAAKIVTYLAASAGTASAGTLLTHYSFGAVGVDAAAITTAGLVAVLCAGSSDRDEWT